MKHTPNRSSLSCRPWLGKLSLPVIDAPIDTAVPKTSRSMGVVLTQEPNHDFGAHTFNICNFGANGDDKIPDTDTLQVAIDQCAKNDGGTAEQDAKRENSQIAREYFGVRAQQPFGPPSYGMYAQSVRGLTLQNIRFGVEKPDLRPAVIFDNVQDAVINGLSAQRNPDAESLFRMTSSKDILMTACRATSPVPVFLQVEGIGNENIRIDGGDLSKATALLAFKNGADAKSVKLRE